MLDSIITEKKLNIQRLDEEVKTKKTEIVSLREKCDSFIK